MDGLKLDGNAWCSLADRLRIMRLWLSVLGRIAKRLGHGCSLTDLIGAADNAAAEDLLHTAGATLSAAVRPLRRWKSSRESNLDSELDTFGVI